MINIIRSDSVTDSQKLRTRSRRQRARLGAPKAVQALKRMISPFRGFAKLYQKSTAIPEAALIQITMENFHRTPGS
jgi:hypothetical protein